MSKTFVLQQECHTDTAAKAAVAGLKHDCTENQNPSFPPSLLLRTSSLDRIWQFPAYLCRRGSNSVLFWLYSSRSVFREAVSSTHKQLRGLFLALCVYMAIGLIATQVTVCCLVMSIAAPTLPSGFIFLLVCSLFIGTIGMKTIPHNKELLLSHSQ